MADNGNVVDELVVKLTLDTGEFKKADKQVDQQVEKTEKKRVKEDDKRSKREKEQIKRTKQATSETKTLTSALKGMSLSLAGVLGVGSVAGLVGSVVALAGMETNLRRTAVSTNLSNREMQAWGSTARRLGADASSGAQAIADLAREQQQFNITGSAPTLAAFSRMGIRAGADTPIADILEQAQHMYRASSPAQQRQIESGLSAQGVSPDLILMIKSETDARAAYTKSLTETAEENKKALAAVADAMSAVENSAINVANSLATILQPAIEAFADWSSKGAAAVSAFVDRVMASGGGLDGFIKVMREELPTATNIYLGALTKLGEYIDILTYGIAKAWGVLKSAFDKFNIGDKLGSIFDNVKEGLSGPASVISNLWTKVAKEARSDGPAPIANLFGLNKPTPTPAPSTSKSSAGSTVSSQDLMTKLITKYGFTVPQAAAVAANAQSESGGKANAFNPAGGGSGARGLLQWRGARSDAFFAKYGVRPDGSTLDQQLDFLVSDPYESGLLRKSLSAGGGAQQLGKSFSDVFEGHGNLAESIRRGQLADKLASGYNGTDSVGAASTGTSISIQSVTVQASDPGEFVNGIQRLTGPQNRNSAVR
jgi:hypothetical protein